jgi:uncharacterized protein
MNLPARRTDSGLIVHLRVQPKASRDAIEGVATDAAGEARLKVRVRAVPDKGAANAAVCALLARALGVPRSAVSVTAGHTARSKTVAVPGDPVALEAALALLCGTAEPG